MGARDDEGWFGERDGRAEGPYSAEALRVRIRQDPATWRVWRAGMRGWQSAEAVFGSDTLAPAASTPVAPAPAGVEPAPVAPAPAGHVAAPAGPAEAVSGEPTRSPPRRGAYPGRHWRGELGLGVSYWVNGWLLTIAIVILLRLLGNSDALMRLPALGAAFLITGLVVVLIVVAMWQVIGTWRSARRHVARGGNRIWAGLAKVLLALGMLRSAIGLGTEDIPTVLNAWVHVAQLASLPASVARSLRHGTELEFSGGIRSGSAAILQRGLDAAPAARVLHLDSPGGDILEAAVMADSVRRRGLATYVRGECLSACTMLFLAGQPRLLKYGARLGFHRPWTVSVAAETVRTIMRGERERMQRAGLPAWFIERVMATTPAEFWFPTDAELSRAGVLSRRVDGNGFSPGRPPTPLEDADMAEILRRSPAAAALEQADPAAFARLLRELLDLAADGGARTEMVRAVQRAYLPAYAAGLRVAPDVALILAVQAALPPAEASARRDPAHCRNWLMPRAGRPLPDVTDLLSAAETEAFEAAVADILTIGTTPARRVAVPAEAAVRRPLQRVVRSLADRLGPAQSAILEGLDLPGSNPAALPCGTTVLLYREILLLPPHEAGPVLRHILSRS